jgi:hypothetical protein
MKPAIFEVQQRGKLADSDPLLSKNPNSLLVTRELASSDRILFPQILSQK